MVTVGFAFLAVAAFMTQVASSFVPTIPSSFYLLKEIGTRNHVDSKSERQSKEFGMAVNRHRCHHHPQTTTTTEDDEAMCSTTRRHFLKYIPSQVLSGILLLGQAKTTTAANAAMENTQKVFAVGKDLTFDQAKARFKEGQQSLDYLLKHYDEIVEGGGDNVRRYLGTVGTTSGLYGISKVMKTMQNEADDIVEYTETMNEVNAALQGADGSAYMAIFTVTSTSGVPPEKYFGDAKIEIKRAIKSMEDIATQLNIR